MKMALPRLTIALLALWLAVSSSLEDGEDPLKTPCKGESCPEDSRPGQSQPDPRVGASRTKRQRQPTVIVVEEEEEEGEMSHRVACTRAEKRQVACLNGECYALDLGGLRSPFCECPAMYEGARCEQLSSYYFLTIYSAELKKAGIIAGVFFLVVLIIVLISVYCSIKKGREKRRRQREREMAAKKGEISALKKSTDDLAKAEEQAV